MHGRIISAPTTMYTQEFHLHYSTHRGIMSAVTKHGGFLMKQFAAQFYFGYYYFFEVKK